MPIFPRQPKPEILFRHAQQPWSRGWFRRFLPSTAIFDQCPASVLLGDGPHTLALFFDRLAA